MSIQGRNLVGGINEAASKVWPKSYNSPITVTLF